MIYFVVNNDAHYFDVSSQLPGFAERGKRVTLIVVPVTLRVEVERASFARVATFESPIRPRLSETSGIRLRRTKEAIADRLPATPSDVVVLYTDREPLNCVIASHFRRSGARVVLIEEGIASYLDVASRAPLAMRARARAKTFYARVRFGLRDAAFVPQGPFLGPRLDDNVVAARLYYLRPSGFDPARAIFVRNRFPIAAHGSESTVVFCNQPLYGIYMSGTDYLDALRIAMDRIVDSHERVVFKFHPRDSAAMKAAIIDTLGAHRRIAFRDTPVPVESEFSAMGAGIAYSFFSGALLSLAYMGCRAVFLYDAMRDRLDARTVAALDRFLLSLGRPSVARGAFPTLDQAALGPYRGTLEVSDVLQRLAEGEAASEVSS